MTTTTEPPQERPDAGPPTDPPRGVLRVLLLATALMAVLTAAYSVHYLGAWAEVRAGKDILGQRATMGGVAWFKRPFVEFVDRLERSVPPDAKVLVEPKPHRFLPDGRVEWLTLGQARWFLFTTYYAYPIRVYVRRPELASGTLVDYPRWLEYHSRQLAGPDGEALLARDDAAIEALGIEYRLRYPVTKRFQPDQVELARRVDGEWVPLELAPRRADLAAAEDDGDDGDDAPEGGR